MRLIYYTMAAAVAVAAVTPAAAVTIVSASGVTQQALGTNANLQNNSLAGVVYLFNEGTRTIAGNSVTSYLLHYDRRIGDPELNSGSFGILLAGGESVQFYTTTAQLNATDAFANTTANYSNSLVRGLESPSAILFGDTFNSSAPNPITVTFSLDTAISSLDEARFIVTGPLRPAVPEPATWAMMIAGFALTGAVLRRRSYQGVAHKLA